MIVVMGASGQTGSRITRELLNAGESVLALGRSKERLAELEALGAHTRAGDAGDQSFLSQAFWGADSVFTMLAYDPFSSDYHGDQARLSDSIIAAIRTTGVRHVIFLSSLGAELPSGAGFITSLHNHEQKLFALEGTNVLILRSGWFFENFHAAVDIIEAEGYNCDALGPDVAFPMIATQDIARVAATALRDRDFQGATVRELLGERDLSYSEATKIYGREIGKPDLAYVQLGYREMAGVLTGAGLSEEFAGLQMELIRALNEGVVKSLEGRGPTNSTTTRFEEFAKELAAASAGKAPSFGNVK